MSILVDKKGSRHALVSLHGKASGDCLFESWTSVLPDPHDVVIFGTSHVQHWCPARPTVMALVASRARDSDSQSDRGGSDQRRRQLQRRAVLSSFGRLDVKSKFEFTMIGKYLYWSWPPITHFAAVAAEPCASVAYRYVPGLGLSAPPGTHARPFAAPVTPMQPITSYGHIPPLAECTYLSLRSCKLCQWLPFQRHSHAVFLDHH